MNQDQIAGTCKIVIGKLEEKLATLRGDRAGQHHARQKQTEGDIQRTIGEARQIINRSLKRNVSA